MVICTSIKSCKTRSKMAKRGSGGRKAPRSGKGAFSLPYLSYNLHYTKFYKFQKQGLPSSCPLKFSQDSGASISFGPI